MVTEWMLMTAAEVAAQAEANALVIIPVASMEQHGPHLATGVDIVLGTGVAQGVAARLQQQGMPALTMPCVWSGLAEHHMAFGGSVTLTYAALSGVLRELARSAVRAGFRRVMLLNGHGGNAEAVAVAAAELGAELGIRVAAGTYWHLAADVIAPLLDRQPGLMHACEAETSMIMALRPEMVRQDRLADAFGPSSTRVDGQPPALTLKRSFRELTPSGVVGDARTATPDKGRALLAAIVERVADQLANPELWF